MTSFIEKDCIFTHEGCAFESGGSAYNDTHAMAYMSSDMKRVTTWHGEDLGPAHVVSSWAMPVNCFLSSRQYQVEATIAGVLYTGRTMGGSMAWKGKAKRS